MKENKNFINNGNKEFLNIFIVNQKSLDPKNISSLMRKIVDNYEIV